MTTSQSQHLRRGPIRARYSEQKHSLTRYFVAALAVNSVAIAALILGVL